jgi:flagella basal body P-ring formation protein FlgA
MRDSVRIMWLLFLVCGCIPGLASVAEIRFFPACQKAPGALYLADLAEIRAEDSLAIKLAALPVGYLTGKPGQVKYMSSHTVERLYLRSLSQNHSLKIKHQDRIKVHLLSTQMNGAQVEREIRKHLSTIFPQSEQVRYEFFLERLPAVIHLPQTNAHTRVSLPVRFKDHGHQVVYFHFGESGKSLSRISIPVVIKKMQPVVVASGYLKKGTQVQSEQLEYQWMEVNGLVRPVLQMQDIRAGSRLLKSVSAGKVITFSYLEEPWVVNQGDIVRAHTRVGMGSVSVLARAINDGRAGQIIYLDNPESGKRIRGRIDTEGLVWVVN